MILDHFIRHVVEAPDSLAIQDDHRSLSYGQLNELANGAANLLRDRGVPKKGRIPFLCAAKSNGLLAIIAAMKADCAYVPLDVGAPAKRLKNIIERLESGCILTDTGALETTLKSVEGLANPPTVFVLPNGDEASAPIDPTHAGERHRIECIAVDFSNTGEISPRITEEDIAYIVFTSGSTGEPKGVMIPHRAIQNYAEWSCRYFNITPDDRLSSHAPFHFDLSVFDIYSALYAGASLYPVPRQASLFPVEFFKFVDSRQLTVWCSVPSLLTHLCNLTDLKPGKLGSLREITFCGEVMPTATIIKWMKTYPHIRYVNQYGPSETTCASMYYHIETLPPDPTQAIPIGKAISNTEVFAVAEGNTLAEEGKTGTLHIRGRGNGLGYWRAPDQTASAFVQNPINPGDCDIVYNTGDLVRLGQNGNFYFFGRADHQIKLMGHRIELHEIEAVMSSVSGIHLNAVVTFGNAETNQSVLVGCYSAAREIDGDEVKTHIRAAFKNKLPSYMIPKHLLKLDELPLNQNGKVDRIRLTQIVSDVLSNSNTAD
ncbi:MAG: amino acid adenylation domain-containing protein [Alphaproteobacteria bacterium]|uniref:amino acid adenylation domain-containing protein n=1 Tax=Alphaproteobacteria TaxID=28211 RepID=UPI0032643DD5